jgi:predicted Fe-Mo cluster-binding NifX family protein
MPRHMDMCAGAVFGTFDFCGEIFMVIAVSGEFGDDLKKFVYYRIENGRTVEREEIATPPALDALKKQFANLQIDLLICGRIPAELEKTLFDHGVNVISGINGKSDQILNSYLNGTLQF